jgi:hypothetical protein
MAAIYTHEVFAKPAVLGVFPVRRSLMPGCDRKPAIGQSLRIWKPVLFCAKPQLS